jgi:group II intron maturase
MHGSMWRELETEQGTCPWSLGWDNHPGNRGRREGPRTYRQEKQPRQFPTLLHHRWVESFTRKGRYFLSRWPSDRSVRRAKDRIRSHTARRWLLLSVKDVVEHLNWFLAGWRGYFRYGNSTMVFHDLDEFVVERLARFISKKHGHHGRGYGLRVLLDHEYLGLVRLVGSIRYGPAHAVR